MFFGGSIVRGEETAFSDLDLVVVYEKLQNAYRESFYYEGFPVEAFVHDPETLNYFFYEVDRLAGVPSLAQMITEGIEIPKPSEMSEKLKRVSASLIESGPPQLSDEDIRKYRYGITNLVDDIRAPRSNDELTATGTELYETLADYYFRANNLWSAHGKSIPRILNRVDEELCKRFNDSFAQLFGGDATEVIALAEELLEPNGGFYFEGYLLEAPANWRKAIDKIKHI